MKEVGEAIAIFCTIVCAAVPIIWFPIAVIAIWFPETCGAIQVGKIALTHGLFLVCSLVAVGVYSALEST